MNIPDWKAGLLLRGSIALALRGPALHKRQKAFWIATSLVSVLAIPIEAHAVFLNPAGLGEVLVYPYYTVNGGNSTAITIVNTTEQGKAIKVRFLEAYDGRDVLDFNLYLSPQDVWTGQVVPSSSGAGLITGDNSCTVPAIPQSTLLPFSTQAFDGSTVQGKDGGPTDPSRTLEGYLEVIEMGTVTNASQNTLQAITHVSGVPANCGQLTSAWASNGYWTIDSTADIGPPSGGLTGTGTLVNVSLGSVEGYPADAVAQFYASGTNGSHSAPDALTPNISNGTSLTSMTYPGDVPVTSTYARALDAVSSVFMADSIINEYWTSGDISSASEWVVAYPTKAFYTDPYYVGSASELAQPPFDVIFGAAPIELSCSPIIAHSYDREANGSSSNDSNGGPRLTISPALCFESQVISFNQGDGPNYFPDNSGNAASPSAVLGSRLAYSIATGFMNGWTSLDLFRGSPFHQLVASSEGHVFTGLPVSGFWVTQFVNGNVGGVLANYTTLIKHKAHVSCTTTITGSSGPTTVPCS